MKMETSQASWATLGDARLPVHEAEELTAGMGRALIRLGGETWVLRITRAGKLILTK